MYLASFSFWLLACYSVGAVITTGLAALLSRTLFSGCGFNASEAMGAGVTWPIALPILLACIVHDRLDHLLVSPSNRKSQLADGNPVLKSHCARCGHPRRSVKAIFCGHCGWRHR